MQLHDTLTGELSDVQPIDGVVTVYSCGPTVYDYPHIGNWYAFIRWDVLNRALIANGYTTKWVMNITDVGHLVSDDDEGEDKLEKGAKREGKTAWDVAKYYSDYFTDGLKRLNFSDINLLPKATDHIPEQIELIKVLEEKGHTYTIDDGVYFDTATISDYGKLAQLDIKKLRAGARVEYNPQKRNFTDFALWKFSPKNEQRDMEWVSPWGKGFPGWHIECSAMSMKYLGETLSIHAGGIDHIPVHHTNEIAQSEAVTGKPFANTWVHSNFILVDGKKMSKSLGNFYTLEDIEEKSYSLEAFRLMVLSSKYHTEAQFSWEVLESFNILLKKLHAWSDLQFQNMNSDKLKANYDEALQILVKEIANNLNTPQVLGYVHGMLNRTSDLGIDSLAIKDAAVKIDALLGLKLSGRKDITNDQKALLAQRKKAREASGWTESDKLRNELFSQGIEVRDTLGSQIWSRV